MNKRTSLLLVVLVLGLFVVGVGITSAQANCMNADGCPLGQQNGPMGGGRFGGQHHGMMQGQMWGRQNENGPQNGPRFGQQNGQQNGPQYGLQNGAAGRGMMGNGFGMMNGVGNGQCGQPGSFACLPPATDAELTDEQVSLMATGWQDEINAGAVYAGIIDQFGELRPFANIEAAEAQHASAWAFLFDRYGLALPEATVTVDVPEFATVTEACQFALDVETGSASLYDELLAAFADYPDVTEVVTSLRNASEQNHTAALEHCAAL